MLQFKQAVTRLTWTTTIQGVYFTHDVVIEPVTQNHMPLKTGSFLP